MKITFISVFNEASLELGRNHLESLKLNGIDNYMAYVTDLESYRALENKYNVTLITDANISNEKKDFATEDFNRLSYIRYHIIKLYLERNEIVWYLDVDTVVLKDLNEKFKKLLEKYKVYQLDILFQNDINSLCTGCMILFPTIQTKNLINKIISERILIANDQMLLNYFVLKQKYELSFDVLDFIEFPIGYFYFNDEDVVKTDLSVVLEKKREYNNVINKETYFIHANWMIGTEKKIEVLKKYNLWFLK